MPHLPLGSQRPWRRPPLLTMSVPGKHALCSCVVPQQVCVCVCERAAACGSCSCDCLPFVARTRDSVHAAVASQAARMRVSPNRQIDRQTDRQTHTHTHTHTHARTHARARARTHTIRACPNRWRAMSANPRSYYQCDACQYQYNLQRTAFATYCHSYRVHEVLTALTCAVLVAVFGGAVAQATLPPLCSMHARTHARTHTHRDDARVGARGLSVPSM